MESKPQLDRESLKKVFQSIDKDNNGYIDISEIAFASKELGIDASDSLIKEVFDEIDKNHDKKISFEEFSAWFSIASGSSGSKKFGLFKLKALNLAKKSKLKVSPSLFGVGANTHEVVVRLGDTEQLNTKLKVEFTYGNQAQELFKPYADAFGYEEGAPSLVLKFQSNNPENAKAGLKDLIDNALELAQAVIPGAEAITSSLELKYHHDEQHVFLGITTSFPVVNQTIYGISDVVGGFVSEEHGANASFEFGLKNDFATLKNSTVGILEELISGVLFDFRLTLDKAIVPTLRDSLLGGFDSTEHVPKKLRRLLLLTLLQESKVEFNIKNPTKDDLQPFIPVDIAEFASLNFNGLLEQLKSMQPGAIIESIPSVSQALDFAKANLNASVTVVVKTPKGLLHLHFKTHGIKEVVESLLE